MLESLTFPFSRFTRPAERRLSVASSAAASRERLVIVGNGMVGQRFCERLVERSAAERYAILVVAEEATPAYDRVHLTDIWRGRDPRELMLRDLAWYREHGVELRLGERVRELNRRARTVITDSGASIPYDKLVFATGSRAHLPELQLENGAELLPYRTLEDAQRILTRVRKAPRGSKVVTIGGGLLGLEAARTLQQLGCDVLVLEGAAQLLPRQLDPDAARELAHAFEHAGIGLRLRARISGISAVEGQLRVELAGGPPIFAGVVVAAAGARACDEVARAAGLRCDARGGISVDRRLQTSDPAVFAIGECAAHAMVPHGLVAPGYAMADVLAENLMGKRRRRLEAQHAVTRLKLDLTEVTVLGNPLEAGAGEDVVWSEPGVYRRLVVSKRRIVAASCIGAWQELSTLQKLVGKGTSVPRKHLDEFARSGKLRLENPTAAIGSLPDAAVVCQCASVTCGTLRRSIAEGHRTLNALSLSTSAGTLCGSCRPQLAELCGAPSEAPPERALGIGVLGALAAVAACLVALLPRIPVATSIRLQNIDVLWIDSFWKQVTGFGLVGVVAIGLSLSLRKRVKRWSLGDYGAWRMVHGLAGLLALVILLAHTGLRLGENLNMVLSILFLGAALTGGAAGVFSATTGTPARLVLQRCARTVRAVHDRLIWPLALFATVHVFKVYYF